MVFLRIILVFACISSTLALFFGPPAKECRSDRDCRGFRRTSCEGRGPNFLFIFPTCGRQRPYTLPGKCNRTPDTWCHIGNALGQRNRCNDGSRCAQCLGDQDCPTREVKIFCVLYLLFKEERILYFVFELLFQGVEDFFVFCILYLLFLLEEGEVVFRILYFFIFCIGCEGLFVF